MDYSLLKKDLDERGYFRVSINPCIPLLENLRAKIFSVNNCLSESKNLGKISDDRDIVNFRLKNQSLQYLGVKHLWNSSALFSLGGHPYFEELLKSICKFKEPIHNLQPLLRVDLPIKEQSRFSQHQDYAYNCGSENSVTIWIPLQDTSFKEGSLLVCAKSHLNEVYPNKKGIIEKKFKFKFENCDVKYGQAIIFNQKLVHASGYNCSDKIRFSVQLRFSDLGCNEYKKRNFPINSEFKTLKYQNEIK